MRTFVLFFVLFFTITSLPAQSLKQQLVGKTYKRTFYAAGFKHQASYTFYSDRVKYSVSGFFVRDTYYIKGKYYNDRFVGEDPNSGEHYVLHIKIISPGQIQINKQGVDPAYQAILSNKPVKGWHTYYLATISK